jgi:hypothetical protein
MTSCNRVEAQFQLIEYPKTMSCGALAASLEFSSPRICSLRSFPFQMTFFSLPYLLSKHCTRCFTQTFTSPPTTDPEFKQIYQLKVDVRFLSRQWQLHLSTTTRTYTVGITVASRYETALPTGSLMHPLILIPTTAPWPPVESGFRNMHLSGPTYALKTIDFQPGL